MTFRITIQICFNFNSTKSSVDNDYKYDISGNERQRWKLYIMMQEVSLI